MRYFAGRVEVTVRYLMPTERGTQESHIPFVLISHLTLATSLLYLSNLDYITMGNQSSTNVKVHSRNRLNAAAELDSTLRSTMNKVGYDYSQAVPFLLASPDGFYKERYDEERGYRFWSKGGRKFVTHVIGSVGDKWIEVSSWETSY
jgi:hypothetical protein